MYYKTEKDFFDFIFIDNSKEYYSCSENLIQKCYHILSNLKYEPFISPTSWGSIQFEYTRSNGDRLKLIFLKKEIRGEIYERGSGYSWFDVYIDELDKICKIVKEFMEIKIEEFDYDETERIKEILLFRKIVKVEDDTLYLDNGLELTIIPNEGCGYCGSGMYNITELNECDNVITNVEFSIEDIDTYYDTSYKIYVFAENKKIKILQVDGSDGNCYYGTGYSIRVKEKISNL